MSTATDTSEFIAAAAPARLPGTTRTGLSRARFELRTFFREKDTVIFTFALPILLLVVFGAILGGTVAKTGVSWRQYFIAGMIASGIMSTTFNVLGSSIAVERDDGTLQRLAGTPMPPAAYFVGKIVLALVLSVVETAIMLAIGAGLYGLKLPADPGRWLTFLWVVPLSVAACALLGIAVSSIPGSARSASAFVTLPYLALQFISGVYFPFSSLPRVVQQIAAVFPLKWMCQGLRSVFLPDALLPAESGNSWEHPLTALVLIAWVVAGLALCLTTFRWTRRRSG